MPLTIRHPTMGGLAAHGAALLCYLILALALTWPLASSPASLVIGGRESRDFTFEDASQNIWNIWWVGQAMAQGQNPFWSDLLYYPEGVQLYVQTLNLAGALPMLPIHYSFGPVVAYSGAILLAMTLTGYASFLLARAFVPGFAVPLLAGALLTASPFHMMKLQGNHLNLMSMQWMVLYVLALVWLDRRRDGWAALAAALLALLVVLTDWYWALSCVLFTLAWAGMGLIRRGERWRLLRAYALLGVFSLAATAPLLAGIWATRDRLPVGQEFSNEAWRNEIEGFSSDALGLFFPALWRFLSPEQNLALLRWLNPASIYFYPEAWYVAAGWVLLALAAVGVWSAGRRHWQLLATGAVMWMFSLGPTLTIMGERHAIPLPYALIQGLPIFASARRPSHFAALCIVVAVVFAALGLHRLSQRLPPPGRLALLAGLVALAALELWPRPWDQYNFSVDPLFARMREAPGAVADLPYEENWTSRSLRNQIGHGQPILGGYVARRPTYAALQGIPLFSQIGKMQPWTADITPSDSPTMRAMQCHYRLRHVVVDLQKADNTQLRNLTTILKNLAGAPLAPTYRDGQYLVYELPLFANACQPFLYLDTGWYELEHDDLRSWRWAGASNQIRLINPTQEPTTSLLHLSAEGRRPVQAELWAGSELLARWVIDPNTREYTLALVLPPGESRLTLRAETTAEPDTPRQLGFALTALWLETPPQP